MLYLLESNYKDSVKEYDFTSKMPYDENGFIYDWYGTKREDIEKPLKEAGFEYNENLNKFI